MTQTILYGGAAPLYENLLQFITRSERVVDHDGDEYSIYHTQYASFNLRELFDVLVSETESHPIANPTDFSSEVREHADKATAVIDDYTLKDFYDRREYIQSRDITSAATTYLSRADTDDINEDRVSYPIGENLDRKQCIADILTMVFAERASSRAFWKFAAIGGMRIETDEGDEHHLDEDVNDSEVAFALRDVVETYNERAVLRQPNPTQRTVRVLFNVFEDAGMNPSVREVYGVIVDPKRKEMYQPDDADGREIMSSLSQLGNAAMGMGKSEKRWVNPDEPPLETIKDNE